MSTAPDGFDVRGGAGGLDVHYDELARASAQLLDTVARLDGVLLAAHRALLDPDVVAAAVLAPRRAAGVEAELLRVLDGAHGLAAVSLRLATWSAALAAAVVCYRSADALDDPARDARRWVGGAAAPVVAAAGAAVLVPVALPVLVGAGLTGAGPARGAGGRLELALVHHPDVVDELVGAAPGAAATVTAPMAWMTPLGRVRRAVTGEPPLPVGQQDLAALLSRAYAPVRVAVVARGPESGTCGPAGGVGGLLADLARRDDAAQGERQGDIDVRTITRTGPDGRLRRAYVVDLPGTKDWQPTPLAHRRWVNDLAGSLQVLAGRPDARTAGVARALALAGAGPEDPVLLVGHSQGGLVALQAARTLSGRFRVTHVLTAGAPIGRLPVPPGVQVLALENRWDVVPRLDARPDPDRARLTTVTFGRQVGTVAGNHDLRDSYLPAGRRLDALMGTTPPPGLQLSVGAWEAGAAPFLTGSGTAAVRTDVFSVSAAAD